MMMKDVLKCELEKILVSESDILRLKKLSNEFIKSLKEVGLKAYVGGSLAKGTMIVKEKQDVDIFVVFDYSEDILKLEKILRKMKLPGKLKLVHGSRDYFHVDCGDVILEVIPVVENRDPELAENVTDVSLSHVKYVSGEVVKNPGIADEIKLAKAFARAQKCYGAEGYVRGFSGYSLEILVIYFGGFINFLKKMVSGSRSRVVGRKIVIDPMKYFKGDKEIMRELNSSKLQGPLVLIDPTYKYRNVCAGLGLETFERFLEVSEKFLKSPSLEFFERREIDVKELEEFAKKKKARFLELEFSTDRQEGDIAGTKMRKFFEFFVRELIRNGQEVLKSEFAYSGVGKKSMGYLVVREVFEIERKGPSVGLEEQSKKFCEMNEKCFKRKGFWWARKRVLVEGVLEFVKGFEGEMGSGINLFR
jgi:tRNA nucleotidyltransferase (CCA-adding enzyme)